MESRETLVFLIPVGVDFRASLQSGPSSFSPLEPLGISLCAPLSSGFAALFDFLPCLGSLVFGDSFPIHPFKVETNVNERLGGKSFPLFRNRAPTHVDSPQLGNGT